MHTRGKPHPPGQSGSTLLALPLSTGAEDPRAPPALTLRTTTSNLVAVRRLLLAPDDPEVCGPAPQQRYRLHRKRATMSTPWLLLSTTAGGQEQ
jgi:hypothetical protein